MMKYALLMVLLAPLACEAPPAARTGARPEPAEVPPAALTILAAASTHDVVSRVIRLYREGGGGPVRSSFASSATLARQIEAGAHADLYISASPRWMDHVQRRGLIVADSRRVLLTNALVLAIPAGQPVVVDLARPASLLRQCPGHIALGEPDSVPAGLYARQALQHLGLWRALRPRLVPGLDVRDALRKLELGAVDCAVVYATDAAASPKVQIAARFAPDSHDPIRYPLALLADIQPGAQPAARALYEALLGPAAGDIYRQAGFTIPGRQIDAARQHDRRLPPTAR